MKKLAVVALGLVFFSLSAFHASAFADDSFIRVKNLATDFDDNATGCSTMVGHLVDLFAQETARIKGLGGTVLEREIDDCENVSVDDGTNSMPIGKGKIKYSIPAANILKDFAN
jgi:hypothetical protein